MLFNQAELMGALLLSAAMALLLQPLATPHAYPRLERALSEIHWSDIAGSGICAGTDGLDCPLNVVP